MRDGIGRSLRLTLPARRIAALTPASVEILFAVGCEGQVVLRDGRADYPPAALALPKADGLRSSVEYVAGFRPDLVVLAFDDPARIASLSALRIPVAVFNAASVDAVLKDAETLSRFCGASPAKALALQQEMRGRIRRITERVQGRARPKVYIELDGADPVKPWTAGSGAFVHDLLSLAGGDNIFSALKRPYAQVSAEAVIRAAPEVVIMTRGSAAALRARPGWGSLPALKRGKVLDTLDADLLTRSGPRLVKGLEQLARALHPGAFAPAQKSAGSGS
ncbi:MAG: ABC transporter substrate-binding protein [Deltaproteobacteria bacterium]|nr:ABC transporter substrate-binding protein [Deltaproteobacteria bacterium]